MATVAEEHAAEAVTAAAGVAEEKVNESAIEAKEKVTEAATEAEEKVKEKHLPRLLRPPRRLHPDSRAYLPSPVS